MQNVKKNNRPRGAKKTPSQPTTPLTVPLRETVERPGPDPEDLAIANADDPWVDEPELPERFRRSRLNPIPPPAVRSERALPDPFDHANANDPCLAEPQLFCPKLRLIPE